jgi:type III pantothenate kinase
MELIIDIGNTRAKLALFSQGRVVKVDRVAGADPASVQAFLGAHRPQRIGVASVGGDVRSLAGKLEHLAPVTVIDARTPVPIRNAYGTPLTLGIDRLANAVAAHRRFPGRSVLTIDAGSCITYDVVDAQGVFQGGAISPGLHMRAKAMHAYSARLPQVELTGPAEALARSTEEALRAGVLVGTAAELAGFMGAYAHQWPDLAVVTTGGDGLWAARALKSGIFAVPLLTLEGLHAILFHTSPSAAGARLGSSAGPAG